MKLALTIKDLALSKHLVASEMAVMRGGVNANVGDPGYSPGHASPAAVTAPVSGIDVAKMINDMILQNLGGYQTAKIGTGNPF
jgi:uncharacterized protein (UPF0264 family)